MKILTVANQKGGVGKSAVLSQFAFFLAEKRDLRVLFIDLDQQCNSTKVIRESKLAAVSDITTSQVVIEGKTSLGTDAKFVLVEGDKQLIKLEKAADRHNAFAGNLKTFLEGVNDKFDVCLIDTNPNPDVRMMIALVLSDYVLSPIQLNQEALDGIGALYNDIKKIKSSLNPKLDFIGILPNLVENTPFQKANLKQLIEGFSQLLIAMEGGAFAFIPTRTAVAEAQAATAPIWTLGKSSAREAWKIIEPVFNVVAKRMGV
jgi:chromosome partitioning protein